MPRRLTLATRERGNIDLFLIYVKAGVWEKSWAPIQSDPIAGLFSSVSKGDLDHALLGWTLPLIKALGIPPEGALRKLPSGAKQCVERFKCPLFRKGECTPLHEKMPWCFVPDGVLLGEPSRLGAEAIQLWRAGVTIVLVEEP